ncbi:tRNA1(Val) (adenine(37)-N6)-methyltransferase [Consotaella salsifontis]|uniref:tRNA1(Val) A37 N6-methylase TrmN6 n=1 Tax=Consotaella salsifontis TaxID=1365950 RepID=A0A1T4N0P7_9HYPH|nr:methyltransferase [Consotaella salsifontis]SJZ72607.1 tRNA1(Val) A37 N6-methylase TrmN6 [Consotaella salsifontis]
MNFPDEAPDAQNTLDAFCDGRFFLMQPRRGHRAGLDAMLLAATVPPDAAGKAADLGAGTGAVGFAAALRAPGLAMTLVERNETMAALARASIARTENAALSPRLAVIEADLLASRPGREATGLLDGGFSLVLTNPPFHPAGHRTSPDPLRAEARQVTSSDFLSRWIRTAGALLDHGGRFAMIVRADALAQVLPAMEGRLGDVRLRPVHARVDVAASRVLVSAKKGSRAPLRLLPAIVLHEADGALSPLGRQIGEGRATIEFGA